MPPIHEVTGCMTLGQNTIEDFTLRSDLDDFTCFHL
jgi:hypothetical protein